MSIFPLFLLALGVATARHISYYSDTTALQPIVTRSQERRICAELCMSGLGGTPCGDDCVDITPQGLPLQSSNTTSTDAVGAHVTGGGARQSACPILCENQLGYPLCNCNDSTVRLQTRVNFVKVCGFYCVSYNYQIYGCQNCELYKNATHNRPETVAITNTKMNINFETEDINWDQWCKEMCADGEGGAACNCDILPMSLLTK